MTKESFAKGIGYMLFSASSLAVIGLLGRFGGEIFSLEALIFWRFFAAFVFCFIVFGLTGKIEIIKKFSDVWLHILRAFFALGAQYCFFYYIQQNTLLNATVLLSTGPLFIPIIEWGILRNHVGRSTWVGCFVAFLGMLCVLQPDTDIFSKASVIGLFSGIFQGASQVVFGIHAKKEQTGQSVLYLMFFCSLLSLIPYLVLHDTWLIGKNYESWALLVLLGLGFMSLCNQLSRAVAYQHGTPSRLSTFLYFSVVLAGFFDWLIFNHIPNFLSIVGAFLVILGGALKILLRHKVLKKR